MTTEREAAENSLRLWTRHLRDNERQRDGVVRAAVAAGVTKNRVHQLTGLARTTIDRILEDAPDRTAPAEGPVSGPAGAPNRTA